MDGVAATMLEDGWNDDVSGTPLSEGGLGFTGGLDARGCSLLGSSIGWLADKVACRRSSCIVSKGSSAQKS